jgi:starvation-inducible DNA-binding protein
MSKTNALYRSPSTLSEETRRQVAETLNDRLADGLDLHSQIKVAHWNIKGPQFPGLHPLFETFAIDLGNFNDAIAERAVTLGGRAYGTVRHVASKSRLPEYPQETSRDVEHVRLLAERFDSYLAGARQSRDLGDQLGDTDTADLLTQVITAFEKHAWFLRASSEG